MQSLHDQRNSMRKALTAGRRANGDALVTGRRGINERMEKERRGSQIVNDLNQLQRTTRQRKTMRTIPPVGAIPASRGRASYVPPVKPGGGIASPLTETPDTRTLHPVKTVFSSDGLLAFAFQRTATVTMTDANNAEVLMEFADVS